MFTKPSNLRRPYKPYLNYYDDGTYELSNGQRAYWKQVDGIVWFRHSGHNWRVASKSTQIAYQEYITKTLEEAIFDEDVVHDSGS